MDRGDIDRDRGGRDWDRGGRDLDRGGREIGIWEGGIVIEKRD